MSFEFEEKIEEKKDYTKLLWATVAILFVVMIAAMFLFSKNKPTQSMAVAKHILIACDFKDVADRTRALNLAKELRQRIENGESFAKLAREYSGDPTTARSGGLLPPAARGEYDKAFEDYVWSAPVGQLSNPVATSYGYHLIEVVDRQIHEAELYENELDRRATEALRKKSAEKAPQAPSASAPAPKPAPVTPAPAPTESSTAAAPAPAPTQTEQPAPAAQAPEAGPGKTP